MGLAVLMATARSRSAGAEHRAPAAADLAQQHLDLADRTSAVPAGQPAHRGGVAAPACRRHVGGSRQLVDRPSGAHRRRRPRRRSGPTLSWPRSPRWPSWPPGGLDLLPDPHVDTWPVADVRPDRATRDDTRARWPSSRSMVGWAATTASGELRAGAWGNLRGLVTRAAAPPANTSTSARLVLRGSLGGATATGSGQRRRVPKNSSRAGAGQGVAPPARPTCALRRRPRRRCWAACRDR